MDIALNKMQMDISKEVRRFLEKECPIEYAREMYDNERGFRDDIWAKMVEMDWLGIRIPEPWGGMGMDQLDINIVLEEMGRTVLPGPFFSTVMLGAESVLEAGSPEQKEHILPGIAGGEKRGTLALHEPDGGADPGYIRMAGREEGDGFILKGTKLFVPDAHVADFLVCAARTAEGQGPGYGITLFLVDRDAEGVSVSLLPTMDGTRKLCAVDFRDVHVSGDRVLGIPHGGWGPLHRVLQRAQVGLCAESLGGAQRAMEMAVEYAKIRVQYDLPIGAFQVVKHQCADMYLGVESSRSILYWASWAQDHGDPKEAALAASIAKVYCHETYTKVAGRTLQLFGATGFTWENDIHLYLKRAKANEVALGDPVYHRERVVRLITGDALD